MRNYHSLADAELPAFSATQLSYAELPLFEKSGTKNFRRNFVSLVADADLG